MEYLYHDVKLNINLYQAEEQDVNMHQAKEQDLNPYRAPHLYRMELPYLQYLLTGQTLSPDQKINLLKDLSLRSATCRPAWTCGGGGRVRRGACTCRAAESKLEHRAAFCCS